MHNFEHIVKTPLGIYDGHITRRTKRQYAAIASSLDSGEHISFGLVAKGRRRHTWHHLSKETSQEIIKNIDKQIEYRGTIQGVIHDLQLEDRPRCLKIRELSTNRLIKCYFTDELYDYIHKATEKLESVVYISGQIIANQHEEKIEYVKVESREGIQLAEEFRKEDIDNFIGCCPGLLENEESLQDWIDEVRGRG